MANSAKSRALVLAVVAVAVIAAVLALVFTRRGSAPEQKPGTEAPYSRIKDPLYREQLKVQEGELKEIMARIAQTRQEIAALGDDTNSERYVALTNRLFSQAAEIEANRQKSMAIIRERMHRDGAASGDKR